MRIVTWNINSVRLRIDLLVKFTKEHAPDIVALQETKCPDDKFPLEQINDMGFEHVVYSGQKSYNGVAILSKLPISESYVITLYNDDKRHIAASINGYEIHNFYVPAGGDIPDINENPKYKHKLEYVAHIEKWFQDNRNKDDQMILLGDLNIAPHEHDVWSSKQLHNVISHTQPERKALLSLQSSMDFVDSGRHFVDMQNKLYTWWSYRNRDWQKSNRGRRLDHIWTSPPLKDKLKDVQVVSQARNWPSPSDHVPYILDLK